MDGKIAALNAAGFIEWFDVGPQEREGYVYEFSYSGSKFRKVARLEGGSLHWGLVDGDGHETLPCRFDELMYNGGVVRVKENGLWGLMAPDGKRLTPSVYDSAFAEYSNGLCAVQRKELWGFVNLQGKEVISCRYDALTDFDGERSMVLLNEKYGFIDTESREVTPLMYYMAYPFSEGLVAVRECQRN